MTTIIEGPVDASEQGRLQAASTGHVAAPAVQDVLARQNFALAVPAALAAAIIGAVLWALVGYVTEAKIGFTAIAIGALVGYAIRKVGHGVETRFGILGACCAAFGWALGTMLVVIATASKVMDHPMLDIVSHFGLGGIATLCVRTADPMDALFLGIAVYEGWKLSFEHRLVRR